MKKSTLSKRMWRAFKKDPLYELAVEFFNEGYDEISFIDALNKEKKHGAVANDIVEIRIRNHLRDLCREAKDISKEPDRID